MLHEDPSAPTTGDAVATGSSLHLRLQRHLRCLLRGRGRSTLGPREPPVPTWASSGGPPPLRTGRRSPALHPGDRGQGQSHCPCRLGGRAAPPSSFCGLCAQLRTWSALRRGSLAWVSVMGCRGLGGSLEPPSEASAIAGQTRGQAQGTVPASWTLGSCRTHLWTAHPGKRPWVP